MRGAARLLVVIGIVAAVLVLSKTHAAWIADPPYDYTGSSRFAWSFAYAFMLGLIAYGVGLPDVPRTARSAVLTSMVAVAAAAVAMSVVQLLVGDALLPRFVVFGTAIVLVPWYSLCVAVANGGRTRAEGRDRVVLLGDEVEAELLREELAQQPEHPATFVGLVDPDRTDRAAITCHDPTVVVLDRTAQADDEMIRVVARLHEAGIRVRTLPLFYEQWLGKLPVEELGRVSLMFDIGELHRARYGRLKRLVDLTLALPGLLAFGLVIPFVAVANLFANRGPLFFRQERVGKGGDTFEILKFRTMRPVGVGDLADEWTSEDDPRITTFGRFMRTTHLDELPQVLNIVVGDLSVVGPRPEQPRYVAELREKLPFYEFRHLVRPGLTGWAQVKYGYAGDERDALIKLQYEFYYLRHQSLIFDLRIIGRTIRSVVGGQGR